MANKQYVIPNQSTPGSGGSGGNGSFTDSPFSYLTPPWGSAIIAPTAANGFTASGGVILGVSFPLVGQYKLSQITVIPRSGTSGQSMGFAIYNSSQNLLIDSGAMAWDSVSAVTNSFTSATIGNQELYFCWSGSTSFLAYYGVTASTVPMNSYINKNAVRYFSASNIWSGTSFPSSLGTLTASSSAWTVPTVFFEA